MASAAAVPGTAAGRLPVGVVFGAPMRAKDGEKAKDFMGRIRGEIERLLAEHSPRILGDDRPEGDTKS